MSEQVKLKKHRATVGRGDLERRDWFYLCSDVDELLQRDHTDLFKRVSDAACGELVDVKRERDATHAEAEALRAENERLKEQSDRLFKLSVLLRIDSTDARILLRDIAPFFAAPHGRDDLHHRLDSFLSTPAPEVQAETLDDRLKQAGMLSVAELLKGAPLDAFVKHAGVHDLATLLQWAEMRRGECLKAMALYDLGEKDKGDDLYEWTVAHCAVFTELHVNLRAALAEQGERQEALPLFTCSGKGGEYAKLGYAKPAGAIKAIQGDSGLIVYRDTKSGQLYFRDPRDFTDRMSPLAVMEPFSLGGDVIRQRTAADTTPQPGPDVRALAASLYQACGAYDMPERILDALSAAASGEPFAHMIGGLLPCVPPVDHDVRGLTMRDVMQVLESVPGAPALSSNMCHAIAQQLNAHRQAQQVNKP